MINILQIRVSYADTDQMGMVYYGNYLTYYERGRTELLREIGLEYKIIEERGFYFPVIYAECNYRAPAKYDDLITVETRLSEVTAATITCSYIIKNEDKILVTGKTKHPFVNKSFKPVRFPQDIKEIIEKHIEK
ncbi:MAG: acyl-CoA thioesterase [Endomicrobium sp.]|nr:acyl-CoA thioesterase [Endomicrobium sp.]